MIIEFQGPANKNRTIMISDCSTNANEIIINIEPLHQHSF
ncbi:hypothetical protein TorRG33x02_358450 [Trema orientale]|uniref:Uncharacterized protein n=1 Tax=Trema orientale TaxID=63057 RepID=A0A2P5A3M0_TREOI|nr:hypothetical protein TorRG33x02_358450 [Trema orientale]